MNFETEVGIVHEAVNQRLPSIAGVVAWADRKIAELDAPPSWLVDLALDRIGNHEDALTILRRGRPIALDTPTRVRVILAAHRCQNFDLVLTLTKIFPLMLNFEQPEDHTFPDEIESLLSRWDSLDDLDVIPNALKTEMLNTFSDFLSSDLTFVYPRELAKSKG